MGQRLCLNITNEGEHIATVYQHWGGYTKSSLATLLDVMDACSDLIDKYPNDNKTSIVVEALDRLGFSLEKEYEEEYYHCTGQFYETKNIPDRNTGLILLNECYFPDIIVDLELSDMKAWVCDLFWSYDDKDGIDGYDSLPYDIEDRLDYASILEINNLLCDNDSYIYRYSDKYYSIIE